jgi:energy-coupling factor transporter ATP-binding protein EcfA2
VELSGGYQRLAALAATLHVEPTWLILDEPFAGVDPMKREMILEKLVVLRQRLHLIVVASPQPEEIPQASKRMRMEEGQILWSES